MFGLARVATVRTIPFATAVETQQAGARARASSRSNANTTCGFITNYGVCGAGARI